MFKIDVPSLLRAGTVGAAIAGLIYLMALTPFFDNVLLFVLLISAVLVPIGTGMYYGHLAPGEETMGQSIVGGALSGLVVGIILGIAFGLNAAVMGAATSFLGSIASGVGTSLIVGGIFGAAGAILGALGGVAWKVIQPAEAA